MSDAIDERNPERQQMLTRILEPFTRDVPARFPRMTSPRCLDPKGVSFQRGDVMRLPFPDASFDVVFCRYLLVHLADPASVLVKFPDMWAIAQR